MDSKLLTAQHPILVTTGKLLKYVARVLINCFDYGDLDWMKVMVNYYYTSKKISC